MTDSPFGTAYRQDLKKTTQTKRDDKGKGKAPAPAPISAAGPLSSAQPQPQDDAWQHAQDEILEYDPYDANGGPVELDVAAQREREQALYEYGGAVGPFDHPLEDDTIPDEEATFDDEEEVDDADEGAYQDDVVEDDIVKEPNAWSYGGGHDDTQQAGQYQ